MFSETLKQIARQRRIYLLKRNTYKNLGELKKALETLALSARARTAFLVLPNFHSCFYLKARLHRRVLSRQLDAIFVGQKLQLLNRTCKPGAIFTAICRRDIAGVSNMLET